VVGADQIFVLDRGQLVQQGTHDELVRADGLYAQLWQEQGGGIGAGTGPEANRLGAIPIFAHLPPELLQTLSQRLLVQRFEAGDVIVKQGDMGDRLYIISRGQVDVLSTDPVANLRPLAVLREGDYFGEISLLREAPRIATVRARTPVLTFTLAKDDFDGLLQAIPPLRESIERVMNQRIQATMEARAGSERRVPQQQPSTR
jgi:ATP-binding cassette subfamily B protein